MGEDKEDDLKARQHFLSGLCADFHPNKKNDPSEVPRTDRFILLKLVTTSVLCRQNRSVLSAAATRRGYDHLNNHNGCEQDLFQLWVKNLHFIAIAPGKDLFAHCCLSHGL